MAYDSGAPPLSSTADVTVNVVNTNDMDPVFAQVGLYEELRSFKL